MSAFSGDVAIIGGGIIGTAIAWRLAQAGLAVTIVDAGAVGGEASWAGAGMLAPGGEIDRASTWTAFTLESLKLYRSFVEELEGESGARIDYRAPGAVDVAFTAAEWEQLRARAAVQSEMGIRCEPLDGAKLREMVPLLQQGVVGVLYFPQDALVDPRHVTGALRVACERRRVRIHEHRPVTAVRARNGCVKIDCGAGMLTAAAAVLAAGAWSSQIPVSRDGGILPLPAAFPVKGHLIGYRLQPGSLGPIVRHAGTYLLQRASGFTVAGSSEERVGFDRSIDERIAADIHARACAVLPGLREVAQYERWIGFRPAAEGLEPEIRRLPAAAIWLSYGHYRNGILLAPATAGRVSREIIASLGRDSTSTGGYR